MRVSRTCRLMAWFLLLLTSVAMLQRSYFHFDARAAADRLSGSKKDKDPKKD